MSASRIRFDQPAQIPNPPAAPPALGAFCACNLAALPGMTPQQMQQIQLLYQQALEQAQQAAKPSLPERDLLGMWN
jgi:hypothetical protein